MKQITLQIFTIIFTNEATSYINQRVTFTNRPYKRERFNPDVTRPRRQTSGDSGFSNVFGEPAQLNGGQSRPNGQNSRPTSKPQTSSTTSSSASEAQIAQCIRNCRFVNFADYVCASDGVTYMNEPHFNCAVKCGRRITIQYRAICASSNSEQGTNADQNMSTTSARPTSQPQPSSSTNSTASDAQIAQCIRNCRFVNFADYVCASDGVTYMNEPHFNCAVKCGRSTFVLAHYYYPWVLATHGHNQPPLFMPELDQISEAEPPMWDWPPSPHRDPRHYHSLRPILVGPANYEPELPNLEPPLPNRPPFIPNETPPNRFDRRNTEPTPFSDVTPERFGFVVQTSARPVLKKSSPPADAPEGFGFIVQTSARPVLKGSSPPTDAPERFGFVVQSSARPVLKGSSPPTDAPERFGFVVQSSARPVLKGSSPPTDAPEGFGFIVQSSARPVLKGSSPPTDAPERFGFVVKSSARPVLKGSSTTADGESVTSSDIDSTPRPSRTNTDQTASSEPVTESSSTTTTDAWTFPPTTQNAAQAKVQLSMCINNCVTDKSIKSVCGSDNKTYQNRQFLDCAQQCGQRFLYIINVLRRDPNLVKFANQLPGPKGIPLIGNGLEVLKFKGNEWKEQRKLQAPYYSNARTKLLMPQIDDHIRKYLSDLYALSGKGEFDIFDYIQYWSFNYHLSSHVFPANTGLIIDFYNLHHNPKYYPNPEKIDPDRFLPENINARPKCSFLPFSEGPRGCLGKNFALTSMKLMAIALLQNFSFNTNEKCENIQFSGGFIRQSVNGYKVSLKLRQS
ncbi:hypothetical protein V9T40_006231 [Parthenolecanium corni]|uniref:Kazal-like domain-containing protein n=1 Tax=Parthenolecanium corni TaxID=536013 RepID=A0AAN9YBN6_9HEMI